jgi:hypothetical protein
MGANMPTGTRAARTWLDREEQGDRKNGRVIDKIMVALPRELTPAQRQDLIRAFVRQVGRDRMPWLAAIHDRGKDASNPHAHIILRDRDRETGKRVALLSEKGSTERLRVTWEWYVNRSLEAQGRAERVSRLSLAAQGQERIPERHRGPERNEQKRVERIYGFSTQTQRAPAVTPATFADAGRTLARPKPPACPVSLRAAAPEILGRRVAPPVRPEFFPSRRSWSGRGLGRAPDG